MGFVDKLKGKVSETKQRVSDARDKKEVRDLVTRLQSFPLCSSFDAYWIVDGEFAKHFGRIDGFSLDLSNDPSEQEMDQEFAALEELKVPKREFLEILLSPEFGYDPFDLQGSIAFRFNEKLLNYIGETDFPISGDLYESILTAMVNMGSGSDIKDAFTEISDDSSNLNLYLLHSEYKEKHFADKSFPDLEKKAQEKLSRYLKIQELAENFEVDEDGLISREAGNPPVSLALASDTIGDGRSIDVMYLGETSFKQIYAGQASVTRMIEDSSPHLLLKKHVLSFRGLSTEMRGEENLHWHFCEDGIIELTLSVNSAPRWLPTNKVKELVFGEGYDGLSTNGVTEFEHFYLYMMVRTTAGSAFTLFKHLSRDRQKATGLWANLSGNTLPTLAEFYKVSISDELYDISKHYKTTYTTTWSWS